MTMPEMGADGTKYSNSEFGLPQVEQGAAVPHLRINWRTGAGEVRYQDKTSMFRIKNPVMRVGLKYLADHPDTVYSKDELEPVMSEEMARQGTPGKKVAVGVHMGKLRDMTRKGLPFEAHVINFIPEEGNDSGYRYQIGATVESVESDHTSEQVGRKKGSRRRSSSTPDTSVADSSASTSEATMQSASLTLFQRADPKERFTIRQIKRRELSAVREEVRRREEADTESVRVPLVGTIVKADWNPLNVGNSLGGDSQGEIGATTYETQEQSRGTEYTSGLPTLMVLQEGGKTVVGIKSNNEWRTTKYQTDSIDGIALNYVLSHAKESISRAKIVAEMPEDMRPARYNTSHLKHELEDRLGLERDELFSVEGHARSATFTLDANVIFLSEGADGESFFENPIADAKVAQSGSRSASGRSKIVTQKNESVFGGPRVETTRFAPKASDKHADERQEVKVVEIYDGTSKSIELTEVQWKEQATVDKLITTLGQGEAQAKPLEVLLDAVWPDREPAETWEGDKLPHKDLITVIRFAAKADSHLRSEGKKVRVAPTYDEQGKLSGYYLDTEQEKKS